MLLLIYSFTFTSAFMQWCLGCSTFCDLATGSRPVGSLEPEAWRVTGCRQKLGMLTDIRKIINYPD